MRTGKTLALSCVMLLSLVLTASAQITTGQVSGTVKDQQGAVVPGATVTLVSDTKQTALPVVVTNEAGDFVVTNVPADTYTVQLEMPSFKTVRRAGIQVSAAERVAIGAMTLEVGGAAEVINVSGQAPMIQASSSERSYAVRNEQISALPVSDRSVQGFASMAPGVTDNARSIGGGNTNMMMDGVSTMDTGGNSGIILRLTNESIAEIRVIASNYQAEFGRSSGLQVSVVTKSGSNQYHGGLYTIERNSAWNQNSKLNILNGDPKTPLRQREWGYSLGGPVGKPGGSNKLFFYFTEEFAPRKFSGDVRRFRLPTALERAGDFSQSYDNNGNLYNLIKDPSNSAACTATNTAGCFADGGVLGRIPANRLYTPGLNVLKMWPLPNVDGTGLPYNYVVTRPVETNRSMQPIVRFDYQPMANLRGNFKAVRWMQQNNVYNGAIPGFDDHKQNHPVVSLYAATVDYTISQSMVLETTWGRSQNERAGCGPGGQVGPSVCTSGIPQAPISNLNNAGLQDLPRLYPNAGVINPDYYAFFALTKLVPSPTFVNGSVLKAPSFTFGNRVAAANAPPNIPWPNYLNINPTNDVAISLTKVSGNHTMKAGFYLNHSFKAENQGNNAFGTLSFANQTGNPFDTTFGFANAAIGSFTSYSQSSNYIEANVVYDSREWYVQDSWKAGRNLSVDYGLRFVNMGSTHDILGQESNWFPELWKLSTAPVIYAPGCAVTGATCATANRVALDPRTGASMGVGSTGLIGTLVPGSGDFVDGIRSATGPNGLGKYGYHYPRVVYAPRVGMAYDFSGNQTLVWRASGGLFYDRLGVTQFQQNNNPPNTQTATVVNGQLQNLTTVPLAVPQLTILKFKQGVPSSAQTSTGIQAQLPGRFVLDAAYVGQFGYNLVLSPNLNSVDLGAAFLPQNQDPTLSSTTPGANAVSADAMRAIRGYGPITERGDFAKRTFHSAQFSIQRRLSGGLSFGFNDTWTLKDVTSSLQRFQHDASGAFTIRADQKDADKLLGDSLTPRHTTKTNVIWQIPGFTGNAGATRALSALTRDWQLAAVMAYITGTPYSVGFAYQSGGSAVNLTGSPDFSPRIRVTGDPGKGCSSDLYRQFNAAAFQGPLVGSVGLESSNNYLTGCATTQVDMSLSRTIRMGANRSVQLRMDVFNLTNSANVTGRNTTVNFTSPSDPITETNLPYDASGAILATRSTPATAGFGAATTFQNPRSIQFQARIGF